ncbi:MAG: peptidoglycan bridge formation glycyltransferase FemA/FemB family protein [Candidatus Andersenbacteria bacterium]|nr:peptidoglycan bridge formation glycyltransferase FemA/FemB family protein [Candidatus Andersenbacteria bacterium]
MNVTAIKDRQVWDNFATAQKPNTFLQSWQWGQVQLRDGEGVRYLGFFEHGEQVAAALAITVHARRGNFYLIPHGPVFTPRANQALVIQTLLEYLKKSASQDNVVCMRVAPLLVTTEAAAKIFRDAGFRPAPMHIHVELTWILDINKPEEELLGGMRKTTRHAITKGSRNIQVDIETSLAGFDRFWPLYQATKSRHNFVPFTAGFIRSQIIEFGKTNDVYIPIARYEGKDVAAAIIMKSNDTVFYYHGASLKLPANIPAAHVLHWESIKEAKRRGATRYNFWGVAPDNQPRHPFAGITIFKKGFGGQAIDYLHAQDFPFTPAYWKLWIVETIRKMKRGF